MTVMPFPPYAPDVSPFEDDQSTLIQNVFPRADVSITIFAATAGRLWKMNNSDFSWTPVSKVATCTISNGSPGVVSLTGHGLVRFVVLSGLGSSTPYRIQWSGLNATTTWTSGVNSSDFQDLPDGGIVRSIGGGEYGLITQDSAICLRPAANGVLCRKTFRRTRRFSITFTIGAIATFGGGSIVSL